MEYKERISCIPNLTMDAIIENCRGYIPWLYRLRPYSQPELNGASPDFELHPKSLVPNF